MAFVLKATYGGVMKRLTYPEEGPNAFSNLVKTLRECFSIPEDAVLRIQYTDQDKDKVLLSDKKDLFDAVKVQKLNPLYLEVTVISGEQSKTEKTGDSPWPFLKGDVKEHLAQVLAGLPEEYRAIAESFTPEKFAGGQNVVEKILSGVSSSLAAAAAAAATQAASSKVEESKPATEELKTPKSGEIKTDKKEPEPAKTEEPVEKAVHPGVQCDICNTIPIKGTRHKSLEQNDYDLCQACMDGYSNKKEQFTKIELPLFRPRHHGPGFRGGRCPPGFFGGRPFCPAGLANNRWGGQGLHRWGHQNCEGKPDARFVKDVTVYDGTEMVPGTAFTKIWRFRNTGTSPWPQGTKIVNVGGDKLSEQDAFELQIGENGLAPGDEVDVAASLTAPGTPGRYVTHFRLATPQGMKFGHRMWALIHVLDKDEESPLVADSEAASPKAQDKPTEDVKDTEDVKEPAPPVVKEIPVDGDVSAEEPVEVEPPVSPKTEPTNLGDDGFEKVEQADTKSPDEGAPEETVNEVTVVIPVEEEAPKAEDVVEKTPSEASEVIPEQVVAASKAKGKAPVDYTEQLAKLAELGFADAAQNVALLEKYEGDLPRTINDLVTVNEWDPMLQELEEMGFNDKDLNRSLIFKNNGRLQKVVKDLVQFYKAAPSAP